MHIRKIVFLTLLTLMAVAVASPLQAATPEESFRKAFPDIPLDGSMKQTAVPGPYEIVSNGRVAYYAPGPKYLIIGDMYDDQKRNLTEDRNAEVLAQQIKTLPMKNAVKIGSGPRTVIEITDPDCSFCRQASEYFAKRKDVTRHVFMYPLPTNTNAEAKIRYVLCAKDRAKAYEEAMTGKLDDMKFKVCEGPAVDELVKAHKEFGERAGVRGFGTPIFMIDGKAVKGFRAADIDKILGEKK